MHRNSKWALLGGLEKCVGEYNLGLCQKVALHIIPPNTTPMTGVSFIRWLASHQATTLFPFLSWPSLLWFLHALLRVLPIFPFRCCISTLTGDKKDINVREGYMSSQPGPRRFYGTTGGVIFSHSRFIYFLKMQIHSRLCQLLTNAMMYKHFAYPWKEDCVNACPSSSICLNWRVLTVGTQVA